jgi:hypothetical protein
VSRKSNLKGICEFHEDLVLMGRNGFLLLIVSEGEWCSHPLTTLTSHKFHGSIMA